MKPLFEVRIVDYHGDDWVEVFHPIADGYGVSDWAEAADADDAMEMFGDDPVEVEVREILDDGATGPIRTFAVTRQFSVDYSVSEKDNP